MPYTDVTLRAACPAGKHMNAAGDRSKKRTCQIVTSSFIAKFAITMTARPANILAH
jgi:hypothetical protein